MTQAGLRSLAWILLAAVPAAATTPKKSQPEAPAKAAAEQPATETLDLHMYARIRAEGFDHSRVMDYASILADDIGPRLTGSPAMAKANAWTRDTLTAMGAGNAHLEDWGEFGMGWEQEASGLRMKAPAPAVFIAQAAPWSPATVGAGWQAGACARRGGRDPGRHRQRHFFT